MDTKTGRRGKVERSHVFHAIGVAPLTTHLREDGAKGGILLMITHLLILPPSKGLNEAKSTLGVFDKVPLFDGQGTLHKGDPLQDAKNIAILNCITTLHQMLFTKGPLSIPPYQMFAHSAGVIIHDALYGTSISMGVYAGSPCQKTNKRKVHETALLVN